ncbi:hypothetical protein [Bacillus suaedaesalsae]|nr:hypothetical protein [Bacillus suaedaesalsae]
MAQRNMDQYKVVKGHKAKDSGLEASYEYLTGNETNGNKKEIEKK